MLRASHVIFYFALILFTTACSNTRKTNNYRKNDEDLEVLVNLLNGKFSSELQAKKDTSYFHISLVMVPIWNTRPDGKWMYVEQALSTKLDKPYRQRVYHLQHPSKNIFTSDIYTIKDALSFAGAQNEIEKLAKLTYEKIEIKEGCTVTLTYNNHIYEGGTDGNKCPSDLRGAKYATTKIMLKKGELVSWDQGFDATGKQVWGATKGGYIFLKQ